MNGPTVRTENVAALLHQALASIQAGRLPQGEALCRQVLARAPRNFDALHLLGLVSLQRRDFPGAVTWLEAARAVNRASAPVHSNLAVALLALRRPAESLARCDAALALKAAYPEALCNRGHALCALGLAEDALRDYEQSLGFAPEFYDAVLGRTRAFATLRRFDAAVASASRAIQIAPRSDEAWGLLGVVLLQGRRPDEALAAFDRALALAPHSPEWHNNRGTALRDLRRPVEALAAFEAAVRLRPGFAEVWCNVANLSLDAGKYEEALMRCAEALRLQPGLLDALNSQGTALRVLKRHAEAGAAYEKILAVDPLFGQAQSHLLAARTSLCDWTDRDSLAAAIIGRVQAGTSASAPHPFLWISDSAALQLQCARAYSDSQFPRAAPLWGGTRYGHARLRVAYLSADFTDHPVAHLIVGVLEQHDRERFETFGLSLSRHAVGGAMQERLQRAFEHFEEIGERSDLKIATRLRELEIDIAVDLTGHTRDGRLGVFAFRPAPLQINYLGFAGTSGADFVDYIIGDRVTIPAGEEHLFSERVIRLPHCFLPNDASQVVAVETPSRCDLNLPESGFVFCAFNNAYKLNPTMFDIWMRLLRETPGSVLWLRGGEADRHVNLRREADRRGIDAERLVFASRIEAMDAHLARYRAADLFLDTLPYGAHATARDALWAGLPVLTCAGHSFAARVAASLLQGLDMPDLITTTLEEYAGRALRLAQSPSLMAAVRARLGAIRTTSPVFNTDLYRRHLEWAYLTLSDRCRRGETPRVYDVPSLA
jgi:protein O-GlcNAc transferase